MKEGKSFSISRHCIRVVYGKKKTDKQPIVGIMILKGINLEAIGKEINLLI